MGDLRSDLRAYVGHLAQRVEVESSQPVTPGHRRPRRRSAVLVAAALIVVLGVGGLLLTGGGDDPVVKPADDRPTGTWRELETTLTGYDLGMTLLWTGDSTISISPQNGGRDVTGEIRNTADGSVRRIAPSGLVWRAFPSVVWTGTEVIVAGGSNGPGIDRAAAAYDPVTDTWRDLPAPPGFSSEISGTQIGGPAVWTGTEMISWRSGLAFDPATETWRELAASPLRSRMDEAVVMTDAGVFVWGGCDISVSYQCDESLADDELADGAIYDPAADAWRTIPRGPLGSGDHPTGVWTGHEVIVIVNVPADQKRAQVAAYNPSTRKWRVLPDSPHPGGRYAVTVWTGGLAITQGGIPIHDDPTSGGTTGAATALDPATGTWTELPEGPSRDRHTAVWAGDRMVVAGGYPDSSPWDFRLAHPADKDVRPSALESPVESQILAIPGGVSSPDSFHAVLVLSGDGALVRTLDVDSPGGRVSGRLSVTADGRSFYATTDPPGLCSDGSARPGVPEIVAFSVVDGRPERGLQGSWPAVAPDGRRVAFSPASCDLPETPDWFEVMNVETGSANRLPRALARSKGWTIPLAWSPNGSQLLVASLTDDPAADPQGGARLRILKPSDWDADPIEIPVPGRIKNATYMPDGRVLTQYVAANGVQRFVVITPKTGKKENLFESNIPDSGAIGPFTFSLSVDGSGRVLVTYEQATLQTWTPGDAAPTTFIERPITNAVWLPAPNTPGEPPRQFADEVWDAIAQCETGGNWGALGPTYQGGLGIWHDSWKKFGGREFARNAGKATREEQIIVAERIAAKDGLRAWGCARALGLV
jgi:hypothetical protein